MRTARVWIVACDGQDPEYPFGTACLRCGTKEAFPNPLPVNHYINRLRKFTREHQHCLPQEKE